MQCVLDLEPAAVPKLGEGSKVVHRIDPAKIPDGAGFLRDTLAHLFSTQPPGCRRFLGPMDMSQSLTLPAADDGELANGIVFCRVESRLTGRRLVSLPFSDHCDPLVDSIGDLQLFATTLEGRMPR